MFILYIVLTAIILVFSTFVNKPLILQKLSAEKKLLSANSSRVLILDNYCILSSEKKLASSENICDFKFF